jgi:4-alpha-glucanotransferase
MLIGDLPLYMAHASADVWVHRGQFRLSEDGRPLAVAGVPPDYFSREGQFWGNPVYDWEEMERQHFSWWKERVAHALELCDILRIDHFRGLSACWEIPPGSTHPSDGHWVPVPGRELLAELSSLDPPLLAEDLGVITPDVRDLMREFHIPGMRVLQFGFSGEPDNPHAPGRIDEDVVLYTGTHDNNTLFGWLSGETGPAERERIATALGSLPDPCDLPREMIGLALESRARVVITPVQDLLGLPSSARMNRPGTTEGNWSWRLQPGLPRDEDWAWLGHRTALSGREPGSFAGI